MHGGGGGGGDFCAPVYVTDQDEFTCVSGCGQRWLQSQALTKDSVEANTRDENDEQLRLSSDKDTKKKNFFLLLSFEEFYCYLVFYYLEPEALSV